jgi:hypothetical protein
MMIEKTKKGKLMISIGGEEMSNNEQSFKRAPNVRGKIKRLILIFMIVEFHR